MIYTQYKISLNVNISWLENKSGQTKYGPDMAMICLLFAVLGSDYCTYMQVFSYIQGKMWQFELLQNVLNVKLLTGTFSPFIYCVFLGQVTRF